MYALRDKYPINSRAELEKAAAYFDTYLTRFSPDDRVIISINMSKQASALSVDIDRPWIDNYSRMVKTGQYSPEFSKRMNDRKTFLKNASVQGTKGAEKLAALIDKVVASKDQVESVKMVGVVSEIDKQANLCGLYDSKISDPVMTVFGCSADPHFDAYAVGHSLSNYDIEKIARTSSTMEKIASVVGKDAADAIRKNQSDGFKSLSNSAKIAISAVIRR